MTEPIKRAPGGNRQLEERRRFLRTAATGATLVGFSLAGIIPVSASREPRLRPPGALDEQDFLASCIKCGQCVQVCPVDALRPADIMDGFGVGTPFIQPRSQACVFACDVGQCILACPTGALAYHKPDFLADRPGAQLPAQPILLAKALAHDPDPTLQFTERMGVARLARPEACLSILGQGVHGPARQPDFNGKKRYVEVDRWKPLPVREHTYQVDPCDLCARECPIQGAITLEASANGEGKTLRTPAIHAQCVGCGVCEMVCPAQPAAIVVDPRKTWEGP